jgi:hypothetical protein
VGGHKRIPKGKLAVGQRADSQEHRHNQKVFWIFNEQEK